MPRGSCLSLSSDLFWSIDFLRPYKLACFPVVLVIAAAGSMTSGVIKVLAIVKWSKAEAAGLSEAAYKQSDIEGAKLTADCRLLRN